MSDWKEETNKRREFRQSPDEESDYIPGSKPKKHGPKDFILESFVPKGYYFMSEEGWRKRGSYKKLSDAEKAAEHMRLKDSLYRGLKLRIVHKNGTVLKEYAEIRDL